MDHLRTSRRIERIRGARLFFVHRKPCLWLRLNRSICGRLPGTHSIICVAPTRSSIARRRGDATRVPKRPYYTSLTETTLQPSTERLLGRLIGIPALIAGLAFFAIPVFVAFTEGWEWNSTGVAAILVFGGFGTGLLLMGRSFLKYKPDSVPPIKAASRFDEGLVAHRNQLRVIAEVGCLLTLAHLAAACFGKDWPAHGALLVLGLGCVILLLFARKIAGPVSAHDQDWLRVPKPIRIVLQRARTIWRALFALAVLLAIGNMISGSQSEAYHVSLRVIGSGDIALLFALEALFFRYGDLAPSPA